MYFLKIDVLDFFTAPNVGWVFKNQSGLEINKTLFQLYISGSLFLKKSLIL